MGRRRFVAAIAVIVTAVFGAILLGEFDFGDQRLARVALDGGRSLAPSQGGNRRVFFPNETLAAVDTRVVRRLPPPGWITFHERSKRVGGGFTTTRISHLHLKTSPIESDLRWTGFFRGRLLVRSLSIALRPVPGGVEGQIAPRRWLL